MSPALLLPGAPNPFAEKYDESQRGIFLFPADTAKMRARGCQLINICDSGCAIRRSKCGERITQSSIKKETNLQMRMLIFAKSYAKILLLFSKIDKNLQLNLQREFQDTKFCVLFWGGRWENLS